MENPANLKKNLHYPHNKKNNKKDTFLTKAENDFQIIALRELKPLHSIRTAF